MANSLLILVNNLAEGIHKTKYKYEHVDKKYETCGIKYKYCNYFLEYTNFKDDVIEYNYLCCNKSYEKRFDENLKKRFFNIHKFSKHDINKYILLF